MSPAKREAKAQLKSKGYTAREIDFAFSNSKTGARPIRSMRAATKKNIRAWMNHAALIIDAIRDRGRVGTTAYQGIAYFWAYKYRFWMRGDAHGNGYEGIGIQEARRKIHDKFLDRNLDLNGETSSHDEIINEVFGMSEYSQEVAK